MKGAAVAAELLLQEAELRRIAERIFKLSEADETEVAIEVVADAVTRFANNAVHQNMAEQSLVVSVRTVFDGRTARATTNKTDDESLRRVVGSRVVASHRPAARIVATTPLDTTLRRLALVWGVTPIITPPHTTTDTCAGFTFVLPSPLWNYRYLQGDPNTGGPLLDALQRLHLNLGSARRNCQVQLSALDVHGCDLEFPHSVAGKRSEVVDVRLEPAYYRVRVLITFESQVHAFLTNGYSLVGKLIDGFESPGQRPFFTTQKHPSKLGLCHLALKIVARDPDGGATCRPAGEHCFQPGPGWDEERGNR